MDQQVHELLLVVLAWGCGSSFSIWLMLGLLQKSRKDA